MIPARPQGLFARFFAHHARGRIQRTFQEVRVHGAEAARAAVAARPLLVVCNHTSWWDPLVALYLSHYVLGCTPYALMEAKNLRRLPFFGRVGAFGVDSGDAADGARAMRYAARLLRTPSAAVWVFPQGEERPITDGLRFRPGSAEIARLAPKCEVLPVALRYEFGGTERPSLFVSFGASAPGLRDVAAGHGSFLRCDGALVSRDLSAFEAHYTAVPGFFGLLAERFLARLTA